MDKTSARRAPGCAPDADRLARLLAPALLDRVRDAIIVLGTDHRIWLWNKHAEHLYGWSAGEVLGRHIHSLSAADGTVFADAFAAVATHGEWNGAITQPRRDGGMVAAEARWTRLADERGQPFAIVAIHNQAAGGQPAACAEPAIVQAASARTALLAAWARSDATAHLTLAVNMSACQFRHPDFVDYVLDVLARTGADPRRLKLEVTEGSLIEDVEEAIATMITLKAHGLGFSLDDFGTGYSSLAYLKRLPLDQLKIDQSFVRDVLTDPNAATIAHAVVTLGQSLGLAVIAEGVETEAQRDFLARHNCDAFQGCLFSPPLPVEQFHAFIASRATPDQSGIA